MGPLDLVAGAEPFFHQGRDARARIGCLLIHGFTATPNEVRPLGWHLASEGYTVLGPRLAHHGTEPADMNRSQWHDWYLAALDGWHMLHDLCDRIVVLGMSMGGATALLMAARRPVAAVVSMSAPISLPSDPRLPFVRFIGAVQPFMDKENWTEAQRASRYPVVPTLAVGELRAYLNVVASALLAVTAPALLFHSRMDTAVPPANMERIFRKLGSVHKEMVWYEEARHVLTEDTRVRADLFARITAFIASWTGT